MNIPGVPLLLCQEARRTRDYSLVCQSRLLEPGLTITILVPFQDNMTCSLRVTVIQGSIGRKPPLRHNQAPHGVNADTTAGRRTDGRPSSSNYHHNINCESKEAPMALLSGPGTWVVHPGVSAIVVFFVCMTHSSQNKSLLEVYPRKQHGCKPRSIKCHSILLQIQSCIRFVFSCPSSASISKGEVEICMLQCDLPPAPTFPPLFTSPQPCSGEAFGAARNRELQQKPRCSTCMQGESAAFPTK